LKWHNLDDGYNMGNPERYIAGVRELPSEANYKWIFGMGTFDRVSTFTNCEN